MPKLKHPQLQRTGEQLHSQLQKKGDIPILSVYALHLLQTIEKLGYDPQPFMTRQNLSWQQLMQADARLPYETYFSLLEQVLLKTSHPGLGVEVGNHITLLDQGLLGYAFYSCENLGRAFALYQSYGGIIGQTIKGQLSTDQDHAYFRLEPSALEAQELLLRYEVEMEFSGWLHLSRVFGGEQHWFKELHFTFDQPDYAQYYQQQFACPVRFNQSCNQFVFSKSLLSRPFDTFNPEVSVLFEKRCKDILKDLYHQGGFAGEIQSLLASCVSRYPSIDQLCQHFHLSESTLRRRLAVEKTNYKKLLLNFRLELACKYLKETQLSVTEIAYLVGYSEPANFFRAFQQQLGISPQRYRT